MSQSGGGNDSSQVSLSNKQQSKKPDAKLASLMPTVRFLSPAGSHPEVARRGHGQGTDSGADPPLQKEAAPIRPRAAENFRIQGLQGPFGPMTEVSV